MQNASTDFHQSLWSRPKALYWMAVFVLLSGMLGFLNTPSWAKKQTAAKQPALKQAIVPVHSDWEELGKNSPLTSSVRFTRAFPNQQWWESFQDPQLNAYIQAAINNNPSIAIAQHQLEESRALAREAQSALWPSINFNPAAYRLGLPSNIPTGGLLNKNQFIFTIPLQASYELDLFGKNWDRLKSANKRTEATELQTRAALTSILGEVSTAYFNLIKADALIESQTSQVDMLQRIATLYASLRQAGLTDEQTLLRAQRDAFEARTALEQLNQNQALFSHQLAILTGTPPAAANAIPRNSLAQLSLPTETPAGIPQDLISRRPDVLAQEALLESAKIDVRLARKAFLPEINLGGQVGTAALKFAKLWDWGNVFNVQSLALSQPIFHGGELKAQLNYSKAKQKEALEQYRLTLLTSLREVEDSISNLKSTYNQWESNQQQAALTNRNAALTASLARQGLASNLDYLQNQSELNRYNQAVLTNKADVAIATVSLYRALGGGF